MTTTPLDRCLQQAVGKLKRSVLSRAQLRAKLAAAGHEETVIAQVLDRLHASGAIDDEALGRALVEELQRRKAAGPRMVEAKLRAKGLDDDLIARLLEESGGDEPQTELQQAEALARQTLAGLAEADMSSLRKVCGLLSRRGYGEEVIEAVIDRLGLGGDQTEL